MPRVLQKCCAEEDIWACEWWGTGRVGKVTCWDTLYVACSTCGEEERCIQDLGGGTWLKETTWKTQACVVGGY
jgi:hypothetical protein